MHRQHIQLILAMFIMHFIGVSQGYAQFLVEGKVFSLPKEEPIAFANIGVMNSSLGSISNLDGSFSFHIARKFARDTVVFSALGYASVSVPVKELMRHPHINVFLKEKTYTLSEIVVAEERIKARHFSAGNTKYQGGSLYADTVNAGSSMALLITNRSHRGKSRFDYPSYVQEAKVMIINNTFDSFRLRVRIMDVDSIQGEPVPGQDLLNESVVVPSRIYRDWLTVDLKPYAIRVEQDFFLVFEWILEKSDRQTLHQQYASFKRKHPDKVSTEYSKVNGQTVEFDNFQGNFYFGTSFGITLDPSLIKAHTCYYRLNSFGHWYRAPSVLAARVTLSNQLNIKPVSSDRQREIPMEVNQLLSHYRSYLAPPDEQRAFKSKKHLFQFDELMSEPVEMRVLRDENDLHFEAINVSAYPYELTLAFSSIHNLTPIIPMKKFTVVEGRNRMLTLRVVFKDLDNYHYELAVNRKMGDPLWQPALQYPYLVPVGPAKPLEIHATATDTAVAYKDQFNLSTGDTLFAMRGGTITYTSNTSDHVNRIDSASLVEVLHVDGTIMVYKTSQMTSVSIDVGNEILAGKALAVCDSESESEVSLFLLQPDAQLREIPIYYYVDPMSSLQYIDLKQGMVITYPEEFLEREVMEGEKGKSIH